MVPFLLIANGVVWKQVFRMNQYDRLYGPCPANPLFDYDLDYLSKVDSVIVPNTVPIRINNVTLSDKDEELLIKADFEKWLEIETNKDKDLEEYLWEEGIINPKEVVWADGTPLIPGDPEDLKKFMEIKNKAFSEGIYNSKELNDGGFDDLYIDWFMLKGCSDYGARKLMEQGVRPWEFEFAI